MPNYFKDQKLLLLFYHSPRGIRVDDIGNFVIDGNTGKSLVIAARGGWKRHGYDFFQGEHRAAYGTLRADLDYGDGEVAKEVQRKNPEFYADLFELAEAPMTDTLLVLAYDDGEPIPDDPSTGIVAFRRGGAELVVEFVLSRFAGEHRSPAQEWRRTDGAALTDEETWKLTVASEEEVDQNLYRRAWIYDFSLAGDFFYLTETYDEIVDMDDIEFEQFDRVVYGINQDALEEMHGWIGIPSKLQELLTQEQVRIYRQEKIPELIKERLDAIGKVLFGQPFDDFSADRSRDAYQQWLNRQGAAWDAEMREFLPDDE